MAIGKSTWVEVDDHQLRQLQVDLEEAPGRVQRQAPKALRKGADIVESAMKRDARGHRFLPRIPRSVTSSMLDRWTAEIGFGPIPGTQGRLAHIILHGSINNGPIWDYTAGLRRSEPRILELMAGAAEDSTLGVKE